MVPKSKTDAMYIPAPGLRYEDADTSLLLVDGGEVPFTLKFKLLGSLLAHNLKGDCKIDAQEVRRVLFKLSGNNLIFQR
jgi:hypothetical protein